MENGNFTMYYIIVDRPPAPNTSGSYSKESCVASTTSSAPALRDYVPGMFRAYKGYVAFCVGEANLEGK